MKRALALLEQTKATMPHLPRPVSGGNESHSSGHSDRNNDSDNEGKAGGAKPIGLKYRKAPKRNPSASNRTRIFATSSTNAPTANSNSDISKIINSH